LEPCPSRAILSLCPRDREASADRPTVIGCAVQVMRIATGEAEDTRHEPGKEYARKGGLIGGPKRAAKLSKGRRAEIAKKAARARWAKKPRQTSSKVTSPVPR
jgi:hypothetical protein